MSHPTGKEIRHALSPKRQPVVITQDQADAANEAIFARCVKEGRPMRVEEIVDPTPDLPSPETPSRTTLLSRHAARKLCKCGLDWGHSRECQPDPEAVRIAQIMGAPPPETPSRTTLLSRHAARNLRSALAIINKFATDVVKDPNNAFEWSNDAFQAAAKAAVWGIVGRSVIRVNFDFDKYVESIKGMVVQGAQYPYFSTSIPANLMAQYRLAVWTRVYLHLTQDY